VAQTGTIGIQYRNQITFLFTHGLAIVIIPLVCPDWQNLDTTLLNIYLSPHR
jgi:hypothetical protein